jgi:hygromycin-B 4-O-kinase
LEAVRQIVERHFGSKPARLARQRGGWTNLVFSLEHDGVDLIVRLNPDPEKLNPFLKEQWAVEHARKMNVPVPEILHVGNEPAPYMILRKVAGQPAINRPDRNQILRSLGRYAARINSIRTHGFGGAFDWSLQQFAPCQDWREFLYTGCALEHRLRTLARLRMVGDEKLKRIRGVLESAGGRGRRPALNHGDLRLKNVLVNAKGRIVAILDWENCSSNLAPEWELSLALHDLSIDAKEEFMRGYGISATRMARMAQTVKAFNLINYVPKIERLAKARDKAALQRVRLRLSGALDLYCL